MSLRLDEVTVLVADDSTDIRRVMKWRLERRGFKNVDFAENGQIAVDRAHAISPQLIFLDMIMPEKDGLIALREIRTFLPNAVVVVSSSVTERETVLQFKQEKADLYVLKSSPQERFDEALGKAIGLLQTRFEVVVP
jgi:two-component system chemotaxis response regulator CheY